MILSDSEIIDELLQENNLIITPLLNAEEQIGSSSIDIRLGTEFRYIKTSKQTHFDLSLPIDKIKEQIEEYSEVVHIKPMESFILHPDDFVLASTLEYFVIPSHLTGRLEGRSTWGRAGLQVHSTAGYVDPGFQGSLTFELHNMGKLPLPLFPGIRIGQLSLHRIEKARTLYLNKKKSKYGKITGTKSSMFFEDYEYDIIINHHKNGKDKTIGKPDSADHQ
jgi:dCTP deaminase